MNKLTTLFSLGLLATAASTSFVLAQETNNNMEEVADGLTIQDGVFYPVHSTFGLGMVYNTNSQSFVMPSSDSSTPTPLAETSWVQGNLGLAPDPNLPDPTSLLEAYSEAGDPSSYFLSLSPQEQASLFRSLGSSIPIDVQGVLDSNGWNTLESLLGGNGYYIGDPDAYLSDSGYSSWEDWAADWGYEDLQTFYDNEFGTSDTALIAAWSGYYTDTLDTQRALQELGYASYEELQANWRADIENGVLYGYIKNTATNIANQQLRNEQTPLVSSLRNSNSNDFRNFLVQLPSGESGGAINLLGNTLPGLNFAGVDLTGLQTSGKELRGVNFAGSNVTGLQLNSAINLYGSDLSGVQTLAGFSPVGKHLNSVNFAGSNVTGTQLSASPYLLAANLSGLNLLGLNTVGKNLGLINFVGSQIAVSQLNSASNYQSANLSGRDLSSLQTSSRVLTGVNFQGSTISVNQLAQALQIDGINLSGTGITRPALEAALVAAGKNLSSWQWNLNSITF